VEDLNFASLQGYDDVLQDYTTPNRRYSNSITFGRWLTPDPDNAGADPSDPQTWNAYAYAGNNPTTNVDPSGEDYYLAGGEGCGDTVQCDKLGYVLDQNGNRQVITDQQVLSGEVGVTLGQNGVSTISTDQGTFQAEFFDPHPQTVTVGVSDEDRGLIALKLAGEESQPVANATFQGLKTFGWIVAPEAMALAECLAGDPNCSKAGAALALMPGGLEDMKAETVLAKYVKGSAKAEFPSQFLQRTLREIRQLAQQRVPGAQTAVKLLTRLEYRK
jgi:RHS repeat-associated protein